MLATIGCSGGNVEPTPDIDATVEYRVKQEIEAQPTLSASATSKERVIVVTATPTSTPIPTPIQTADFGDTLGIYTKEYKVTLLSWQESNWIARRDKKPGFAAGYYTFHAPSGMKFINVRCRFINVGVRKVTTISLSSQDGEVLTGPDGYYYEVWNPVFGILSEEYTPSPSLRVEISTVLDEKESSRTLLPGQSTNCSFAFLIPSHAVPITAEFKGMFGIAGPFSFSLGKTDVP